MGNWIDLLIPINLAIFMMVHIPLDIFMIKKRDRSIPLKDYGIDSSNKLNTILGFISLLMWIYWICLCFPTFRSILNDMNHITIQSSILQIIGSVLMIIAVIIAITGRIARGRFAASWGLNETIPLITSGPYNWIRHPSYTFYILMFISLPLISGFLPSLILLPGILVYYRISIDEERLLIHHFGEEYLRYQEVTGRFFPEF